MTLIFKVVIGTFNCVIGKPKVLFLLRNSYFIIGNFNCVIGNPSDLFLLRNSYFIIGTVLLENQSKTCAKHSQQAFVASQNSTSYFPLMKTEASC